MEETRVCFVLDETGSMQINKEAVVSAFNEYVNGLRKDQKNTYRMWLTLFNSEKVEVRCDGVPVGECKELTLLDYQPDSTTPLYDAITTAVRRVQKVEGKAPTLCVVLTDGWENASRDCSLEGVKSLIKEREADGWRFVYLGAHEGAWKQGFLMGVGINVMFDNTPEGMRKNVGQTVNSTRAYASSGGTCSGQSMASHYDKDAVKTEEDEEDEKSD